jgi:uncharacterized protein YegP (UPF0339 family)
VASTTGKNRKKGSLTVSQDRFEVHPAKGGGYFWHLQAANNEIVCSSQVYTTKEAASKGAFWVQKNAGSATVYDCTGEPEASRR